MANLEVHHKQFRSRSGHDSEENLITLSRQSPKDLIRNPTCGCPDGFFVVAFWWLVCCTSEICCVLARGLRIVMSPPPVQTVTVVELGPRVPWLTMLETVARVICSKHLGKVVGALVLLAGLTFLIGCQGVSAAGSSSQKQSSTLSLLTSALDFGSVTAGSSKTLTVTATNSGPASVSVSLSLIHI